MEGGTTTGNTATSSGGGVYVAGSFTMNGGVITGNTSTNNNGTAYGGGVYVGNFGSFTMSGGEITDNAANGSGAANSFGGGVCVLGTFTVSEGTTIIVTGNTAGEDDNNVYLHSGTDGIKVEGLADGSRIGVTLATGKDFTDNGGEGYHHCFFSDDPTQEVLETAYGKLKIDTADPHSHYACGNSSICGHEGRSQTVTFTILTSASLSEDGVYYYLARPVAADGDITIYAQKFSTYAIGYTEYTGGGSGGSSTPAYPPSIVQPEHGTVTISPKNPQKGDGVTIIPSPEAGYVVDEVTVTDAGGKPVEVAPNDDGTFTFVQPNGKVAITVTFQKDAGVSNCPQDNTCPMAAFADADRNAWYHDGVHYCVENGLMEGTGSDTFAPDDTTTRGMIVTILWRLEGSPIVDDPIDYDDVTAENWYGEAVRWADSASVVTGYGNGRFGPNDPITREQMAAMLWRYAGSPEADGSLSSFADGEQTSSWAQSAMIWAVEQGLITGVGNDRLAPGGQATRAQVATILMRFAQDMAQSLF